MNDLETLYPETAAELAKWQGNELSLCDLKTLSPETIVELSKWNGKLLDLYGLEYENDEKDRIAELFKDFKCRVRY